MARARGDRARRWYSGRVAQTRLIRTEGADSDAEVREAVHDAESFHMGESKAHGALASLARRLDALHIPYAVIGAMALNAYGYKRVTVDLDVVLTPEGLTQFKSACLGLGYVERFSGSRGVRDVERGVPIDFVMAGDYPGDGKPKSVKFPDPASASVTMRLNDVSYVSVDRLVELKLASGLSAPHRLKDLADVLELIRATGLEEALAERLDPSVRAKYRELWAAAQESDPDRFR